MPLRIKYNVGMRQNAHMNLVITLEIYLYTFKGIFVLNMVFFKVPLNQIIFNHEYYL